MDSLKETARDKTVWIYDPTSDANDNKPFSGILWGLLWGAALWSPLFLMLLAW